MQAVCIAQVVNGKVRCTAWTLPFCKSTPNCSVNPFTPAVFSVLLQNKGRLAILCFCVCSHVLGWKSSVWELLHRTKQTFQVNSAELKNSLCFPDWTPCKLPITSSWFHFAHYMLSRTGTCILLMEKKKEKYFWLFICVSQSFYSEAVAAGLEMEAAAWRLWFRTSKFCLCLGLSIPILHIPPLDGFKWKEQGLQSMAALLMQPRYKWMDWQSGNSPLNSSATSGTELMLIQPEVFAFVKNISLITLY